jgi:mannosyltransferase
MPLVLTIAALAVGLALRLLFLTRDSLWLDEAYSAYAASKPLSFIWTVTPTYETHPPFYYSLLHLWTRVFGDSLLSLRGLGALAGLLTLGTMWCIGRRLEAMLPNAPKIIAPSLLLVAALAPTLVRYSLEVRPYILIALGSAVGLLLLLRISERWHADRPRLDGWMLAWIATMSLLAWLHTLGPIYVFSFGMALLLATVRADWRVRDWAVFALAHVAVMIVWLPSLRILLTQLADWQETGWLGFVPSALPSTLAITYFENSWLGAVLTLVMAGAGNRVLGAWGLSRRIRLALALAAILPVAIATLLSITVSPVLLPRTLIGCAVPVMIFVAAGFWYRPVWSLLVWRALAIAFLAISLIASYAIAGHRRPQDWFEPARYLLANARPGDVILAYPNETALPLSRATKDLGRAIPMRSIPTDVPAPRGSGIARAGTSGTVAIPVEAMDRIVAGLTVPPGQTVYVGQLNLQIYDPQRDFQKALERRLACHEGYNRQNILILKCVPR